MPAGYRTGYQGAHERSQGLVRLPKTLKIGYAVYKVRRVPDLRDEGGAALWGSRNPNFVEIRIDGVLVDGHPHLFATLLHEVLHEVNDQCRLHLDEDNVNRLANGLAAFLQDNKLLRD